METLTKRHKEVVRLVAKSYTTEQIAELMHISERTVQTHRYRIGKILGASDVASFTRYAIRTGLISGDEE